MRLILAKLLITAIAAQITCLVGAFVLMISGAVVGNLDGGLLAIAGGAVGLAFYAWPFVNLVAFVLGFPMLILVRSANPGIMFWLLAGGLIGGVSSVFLMDQLSALPFDRMASVFFFVNGLVYGSAYVGVLYVMIRLLEMSECDLFTRGSVCVS